MLVPGKLAASASQSGPSLGHDANHLLNRQTPLSGKALLECFPLDVRQHHVHDVSAFADGMYRYDVRVAQLRHGFRLLVKPAHERPHVKEIVSDGLDGDIALECRIPGPIDDTEAPLADELEKTERLTQGLLELLTVFLPYVIDVLTSACSELDRF